MTTNEAPGEEQAAQPPDHEREEPGRQKRRRAGLLAWLWMVLLSCFLIFTCAKFAGLPPYPEPSEVEIRSMLEVDYGPWGFTSFGPIRPDILIAILEDLEIAGAVGPSLSGECLLPGSCEATVRPPPGTPSGTPRPVTSTPTPAPTFTPSSTVTLIPSPTLTSTSPPTATPTPTPLVRPVKLADPEEAEPGVNIEVKFIIVVVNGSDETAELTTVVDTLPENMTYAAGSCTPTGCSVNGAEDEITWSLSIDIPPGFSYQLSFVAELTAPVEGGVLTNHVMIQGNNFEVASNSRQVIVWTPTPTNTAAPTHTPTNTATPSDTAKPSDTPTPTFTPIASNTPTETPTPTVTPTPTDTRTPTHTPTDTPTATPSDTPSPTPTSNPLCATVGFGTTDQFSENYRHRLSLSSVLSPSPLILTGISVDWTPIEQASDFYGWDIGHECPGGGPGACVDWIRYDSSAVYGTGDNNDGVYDSDSPTSATGLSLAVNDGSEIFVDWDDVETVDVDTEVDTLLSNPPLNLSPDDIGYTLTFDDPVTAAEPDCTLSRPAGTWTEPTPTPTNTFTPTSTPTATNTATNTPTATPTHTPTATASPSSTPTPSDTPTSTNTPTITPTPTNTPTPTAEPPQLFVDVSASVSAASVGEEFRFDVSFGNLGPGDAFNVVLDGSLSAACSYRDGDPFPEDLGTLTCVDDFCESGVRQVFVVAESAGSCTLSASITSSNALADSDSHSVPVSAPLTSSSLSSADLSGSLTQPTDTPTPTLAPIATPTPTGTPTPTPTSTPGTPTATPSPSPTSTGEATPTATPTNTPVDPTETPSPTSAPTATLTPEPTATFTPTPSSPTADP